MGGHGWEVVRTVLHIQQAPLKQEGQNLEINSLQSVETVGISFECQHCAQWRTVTPLAILVKGRLMSTRQGIWLQRSRQLSREDNSTI